MAIRKILSSSAMYSLAFVSTRLAGLLLLRVYTTYLDPSEYGVLELLSITQSLVSFLLGSRLGQAIFYFHAHAKTTAERNSYIATAYLGSITAAVICGGLALGAAQPFAAQPFNDLLFPGKDYVALVRLSLIAAAVAFPFEIGQCCLRAFDRQRLYVATSVASAGIAIVVNVYCLAVLHLGVASILWGAVISCGLVSVWMAAVILRSSGFPARLALLGEMARYSWPLTISALAEFFLHFADRYFLTRHVSLADIGVYSVAYKLGMIVSYVQAPFVAFWTAQMFQLARGSEGERLYARVTTYLTLGLTSLCVALCLFISPLLRVLTTPDFYGAAAFVPLLCLAYLLRGIGGYVRSVFFLERNTGFEAKVNVLAALLCLVGYWFLIPRYGVWGAVWSTCTAFGFAFFYSWIAAARLRPVPFEYPRLLWISVLAPAAVAAGWFLRSGDFWTSAAIGSGLLTLYCVGLRMSGAVLQDELDVVVSAVRSKLGIG